MSPWFKWALLAAWCGSLLSVLWFYGDRQLSPFDPALTLTHAASAPDFDQRFTSILQQQGVKPGSIVHLQTQNPCYCNSLTEAHQRELSALLKNNHYQLQVIHVDEAPQLEALLPAYPALAVVDEYNQLRYLGPYAEGLGCYTGDDLVTQIASVVTAQTYLGATVNTTSEGCFCDV